MTMAIRNRFAVKKFSRKCWLVLCCCTWSTARRPPGCSPCTPAPPSCPASRTKQRHCPWRDIQPSGHVGWFQYFLLSKLWLWYHFNWFRLVFTKLCFLHYYTVAPRTWNSLPPTDRYIMNLKQKMVANFVNWLLVNHCSGQGRSGVWSA